MLRSDLYLKNYSLARNTSWRVGGVAKIFSQPQNIQELEYLLQNNLHEEIMFIGLGSNLLIRDSGFDGLVIDTKQAFTNISLLTSNVVQVDAGVSCAKFARFCAKHHLAGAEFFAGIPGTMGGALKMNAGCFGSETWDLVNTVTTINTSGIQAIKTKKDFTISYRKCHSQEHVWFLQATLQLQPGDATVSLQKIKELLAMRANTQPTGQYSCGSVFKNPIDQYAGKLIEDAGLKGMRIGGACVSNKHANFIVNDEQAKAADIEDLMIKVQQIIQEKYNIQLVPEVQIIGNK